eukprot:scaffold62802_cov14-Tisochrysis_lutea.AAC.1
MDGPKGVRACKNAQLARAGMMKEEERQEVQNEPSLDFKHKNILGHIYRYFCNTLALGEPEP